MKERGDDGGWGDGEEHRQGVKVGALNSASASAISPRSLGSHTSFNAHQNRQIVELECIAELGGSAIFRARAAEGSELNQGNEAVVVGVELVHDVAELVLVGEGGAEGAEDSIELPMWSFLKFSINKENIFLL